MNRTQRVLTLGATALLLLTWMGPPTPARPQAAADPEKSSRPLSVQEALTRPFDFPFSKPTTLAEVVRHLGKELHAPVALDRAAMDRVDVQPDDTVELELKGVRLKTGLKLLLDQLDLTYRVEPEDNLLVITDLTGSTDRVDQVLDEVESLHKDIHDLQDAVDEIRSAMGLGEPGERVRKPTIIEEVPPGGAEKPKSSTPPSTTPPARSRPGT